MSCCRVKLAVGWALAVLAILVVPAVVDAQGSVTPSYGDGTLTLIGDGYRPGERVEITVRVGGSAHAFSTTADPRGRFRLATGLPVAPMSRVEIEARDEAGMTQVTTTTSGPGAAPGPGGGMPMTGPGGGMPLPPPGGGMPPPASGGGAPPPASGGGAQPPGPGGGMPRPAQLPRAGDASVVSLGLVGLAAISVVGGLALWGRVRLRRQ